MFRQSLGLRSRGMRQSARQTQKGAHAVAIRPAGRRLRGIPQVLGDITQFVGSNPPSLRVLWQMDRRLTDHGGP
jgi:hypothetical protein